MDDIKVLDELGLQEISRKTHIEVKFLQYMLDKDYDKLFRVNTLGYVKILKREYGLDLSEWVQEYESYLKEHGKLISNVKQNASFTQDTTREKSSKGKWIFILLILALAAGALYVFGFNKYINKQQEQFASNSIVDNAMQIMQDQSILANEENETTAVTVEQSDELAENPEDQVTEDEMVETEDAIGLNVDTTNNDQSTKEGSEAMNSYAIIHPREDLWVGIVNLETKQRKQYLTKNEIMIDLDKPQIIKTGNGNFSLTTSSGKEESYDTQAKKYYYVNAGVITNITHKEFITYNGGKSW